MASSTPDPEGGQEKRSPIQMLLNDSTKPPVADSVLLTESGGRYYTTKELLSTQSVVFKNEFEMSDKPVSTPDGQQGAFELPVPDASAEIAATTTCMNIPDELWSAIKDSKPEERLEVLADLVTFAHKYDMRGATSSPCNSTTIILHIKLNVSRQGT